MPAPTPAAPGSPAPGPGAPIVLGSIGSDSGVLGQILLPEGGAGPVAFAPDGQSFAAATSEPGGCIRVVEVGTGRERQKIKGFRSVVRSLAFLSDGKRLVSGMEDSTALVWDLTR